MFSLIDKLKNRERSALSWVTSQQFSHPLPFGDIGYLHGDADLHARLLHAPLGGWRLVEQEHNTEG